MKKSTLLFIAVISLFAILPGSAQKRKGRLSIMTYNMRISRPDLDDIRDYTRVASFISWLGPNITALQNVDFVTGVENNMDAITLFKRYPGLESGFTRNVSMNPAAYGVGILSANNPRSSWALPLPGETFDPVALIHEYSDCMFICVQFPVAEEHQLEAVALIDSVAAILAPANIPIFVAGSFYFVPASEPYNKMSKNFQPINDIFMPTYPADEPMMCMDYIWAYVASDIHYTVSTQEVLGPRRELSMHKPVHVVVSFEIPKKKDVKE